MIPVHISSHFIYEEFLLEWKGFHLYYSFDEVPLKINFLFLQWANLIGPLLQKKWNVEALKMEGFILSIESILSGPPI